MDRFKEHKIDIKIQTDEFTWVAFSKKIKDKLITENMDIIIKGDTLIILGYYGNAIYKWADKVNLEFLSHLNIENFASKCISSETGVHYKTWNPTIAESNIMGALYEFAKIKYEEDEGTEEDLTPFLSLNIDERDEFVEKYVSEANGFLDVSTILSNLTNQEEWSTYLYDLECADILFGDEWKQYLYAGETIHPKCEIHLDAIKKLYNIKTKDSRKALIIKNKKNKK